MLKEAENDPRDGTETGIRKTRANRNIWHRFSNLSTKNGESL